MYPIQLADLNSNFIESISKGELQEDLILEFKQRIYPFENKEDKKNFLRDIVAMVNGSGGLIILGVADNNDLIGVDIPDRDGYKRQILQNISSIEPQIIGVDFKFIEYHGLTFLAVLVPEGELKPYSSKVYGDAREFLVRQNASNHHLSMSEIRRLFLKNNPEAPDFESDWNDWRTHKISQILKGELFKPLMNTCSVVITMWPTSSGVKEKKIDGIKLKNFGDKKSDFWPSHSTGRTIVPYADGIFAVGREDGDFGEGKHKCYSIVVAQTNLALLSYDGLPSIAKNGKEIGSDIAQEIINMALKFTRFLNDLGQTGKEYKITVSILDAKGCKIKGNSFHNVFPGALSSAIGVTTEEFTDSVKLKIGEDVSLAVKPILDKIWQSSGFDECPFYIDGKFEQKRSRY